jgi:hypothetical protein
MLSSRRHDPFKTQPKGKNIPIEGKLDCLSGERFGLSVKQRFDCEGGTVASTLGLSSRIARLTFREGSSPLISRCICSRHEPFLRSQSSTEWPPDYGSRLLPAPLPSVTSMLRYSKRLRR